MIGSIVSHFQILEKIGSGGMGIVYKARDLKLERFVALKFLPNDLSSKPEEIQRFIHEAKSASALDHPNICTVYEIGETADGQLFICMAYYQGTTLKQKIDGMIIPIEETIDIIQQITKGLLRSHEEGIIHRDVKPANIIVTDRREVKILDFGLAKLSTQTRLTKIRSTVGTVAYMSPEQIHGEDVDQRTDIWSLGVVFYEMIAGKLPFRGNYEPAMMYSIVNEQQKSLRQLQPGIPGVIEQIVDKMLQKKPEDRYQSMKEVIDDITSAVKGIESGQLDKNIVKVKLPKHYLWYLIGSILTIGIVIIFLFQSTHLNKISGIAILPLSNAGNDGKLSYLSDGITQNLINGLSGSSNLRVISFNSVSRYRDLNISKLLVGKELNVQVVLAGSVSKNANRLSVAVSLYDVSNDKILWKEEYDREYADVFTIQEDILNNLTEEIDIQYNIQSQPKINKTNNINAYELYLKGLALTDSYRKNDNELAISYFIQAIEKDTQFAASYISLANAQLMMIEWEWETNKKWLLQAEMNSKRALTIDSTLSGAYSVLGRVMLHYGKREEGFSLLERSIALNGNSAASYSMLGKEYLFSENEPARALTYLIRAHEIEPNSFVTVMNLGIGYAMMQDYRFASQSFHQAISIDSTKEEPWLNLAVGYEHLGLYDSAARAYEAALRLNPSDAEVYEYLGTLNFISGKIQSAEKMFSDGLTTAHVKYRLLYLLGIVKDRLNNQSASRACWTEGLKLSEAIAKERQVEPEPFYYNALFNVCLGKVADGIRIAETAYQLDSTSAESAFNLARVYAAVKNKGMMLKYFELAKKRNPEYDESSIITGIEFQSFKKDPDLLMLARK